MKEKITQYAYLNNIPLIGYTKYRVYNELKIRYESKRQLNYDVFENDIDTIINPKKLLPSLKTIIVIALPYLKTCKELENIKDEEVYFSSSSWGKDYHIVLNEKLDLLIDYIKKQVPSFEYVKCVDTKPVDDRYLAYLSGIGFYGKNNLLINDKFGSYIFIGSILTNLDIEEDKPLDKTCSNCNKCITSCPTNAIKENNIIDSTKCLSYLTQKKELSKEEESYLNNCIYGCDICSRVCPYNINNETDTNFIPTGIEFININDYKELSNKYFKNKYGILSGSWRGSKVINRNIKIVKEKLAKKS